MLSTLLPNTINLVDVLLGGGGSSGGSGGSTGMTPANPTPTQPGSGSPLSAVLNLDALNLLNIKASLGAGESLITVGGNVMKQSNGSLIDLGLDIGSSATGGNSLISVGGKILAQGTDGSLIDLNLGIGTDGSIISTPPPAAAAPLQDVFRFYNTQTGVHFYTASEAERDSVVRNLPQFQYEGNAFDVTTDQGAGPEVFRFYNTQTKTHFYTASEAERDTVRATLSQYDYEGIAYTAYENDGGGKHEALYRFYNTETGAHFYTTSEQEVATVVQTLQQFKYEGIAYYVDAA